MTEQLSCRNIRELLGVYVLGAIDPAERGIADEHLSHCRDCREELAGLASLPALLRRVPLEDAERLAAGEDYSAEPPPELLTSLLERVAARRRGRLVRSAFAIAASVVIAVGGGVVVTRALTSSASPQAIDTAQATSGAGVRAVVEYASSSWGTEMWVQVHGIRPGTTCTFWVVDGHGKRYNAGGWTVLGPERHWFYPAETSLQPASLHWFEITAGNRLLVKIPASA